MPWSRGYDEFGAVINSGFEGWGITRWDMRYKCVYRCNLMESPTCWSVFCSNYYGAVVWITEVRHW